MLSNSGAQGPTLHLQALPHCQPHTWKDCWCWLGVLIKLCWGSLAYISVFISYIVESLALLSTPVQPLIAALFSCGLPSVLPATLGMTETATGRGFMASSLTQLPTREWKAAGGGRETLRPWPWSEVVTLFLTLIFGHKGRGMINS